MKRITLFIGLLIAGSGIAQNGAPVQALKSIIQPSESRGYLCWEPIQNAQYTIKIYSLNGEGVYEEMESIVTQSNYGRIVTEDLSTVGKYYSISAFNPNGSFIGESDIYPINNDITPPDVECERKCNGSTYAYKLQYLTYPDGNMSNRMVLSSTNDSYDPVNGIVTPFYQAISTPVYNAMVDELHPYTIVTSTGITAPVYQYKHIEITSSTPGTFQDKNGAPVTSGWLVEKKMDQFNYMKGGSTTSDPGGEACVSGTAVAGYGGWASFFNNYNDPSTFQSLPSSVEPFATNIPTALECISSPIMGTGITSVSGISSEFIDCLMDAVSSSIIPVLGDAGTLELPDEINLDPCSEEAVAPGISVSGFNFSPINNAQFNELTYSNIGGDYTITGENNKLNKGLYQLNIFDHAGGVLSTTVEVKQQLPVPKNESVNLKIAPNPIINNNLSFTISSEIETNVNIKVYDLNGNSLLNQNANLLPNELVNQSVNIDPESSIPYNQIIVRLVFNDGSVLQKTALMP